MPAAARFQGRVQTDARDASERSSHPSRRSIRQRASIPCKQVHFGALREEYGRAGLTLRKGVPANALFATRTSPQVLLFKGRRARIWHGDLDRFGPLCRDGVPRGWFFARWAAPSVMPSARSIAASSAVRRDLPSGCWGFRVSPGWCLGGGAILPGSSFFVLCASRAPPAFIGALSYRR